MKNGKICSQLAHYPKEVMSPRGHIGLRRKHFFAKFKRYSYQTPAAIAVTPQVRSSVWSAMTRRNYTLQNHVFYINAALSTQHTNNSESPYQTIFTNNLIPFLFLVAI